MKQVLFTFDERSFASLKTLTTQRGFSSMADTVRESLQIMKTLQKHLAQGFTQVVVHNPETNERRALRISDHI